MHPPWMTTRRWMVAVAMVGRLMVLVAQTLRRLGFRLLAAYHESRTIWSVSETNKGRFFLNRGGNLITDEEVKVSRMHRSLVEGYRKAAAQP